MTARRFDRSQLRITRGAMTLAGLELGLSLVWLLSSAETRARMLAWLGASSDAVFGHGRVWTLATSAFLELDFVGLVLHAATLLMLVPTLERFWGTPRFLRFAAVTSVVATAAGALFGLVAPAWSATPVLGLSPLVYASVVAFGVIYARAPVQFFGVLPLTGRQMMFGFVGFLGLWVVLEGRWLEAVAYGAAMAAAAVLTSKRWSPALAWRRWRLRRARAHLSVVAAPPVKGPRAGGRGPSSSGAGGARDERWLN